MLFIEALQSKTEGGKTPPMPLAALKELGFRIVIFPISALLTATQAIRRTLSVIRKTGSPIPVMGDLGSFGEFLDFIGLGEVRELERRYRSSGV